MPFVFRSASEHVLKYSFGKMNLQMCEFNFMILQTSLAIGSTGFIAIANQV